MSGEKFTAVPVLKRLDTHAIPDDSDEIRFFCVLQNEETRLPYLLTYYRNLGVKRFFFIDNKSTDKSQTYLLSQPDCHVFYTAHSYSTSNSGIIWTKQLLDEYGAGHWCLVIDADELFVYPHSETVSLPEFCKFLDREQSETIFTFLLDMYPEGNIKDAVCVPGKPFPEICPYFDRDYVFVNRICLRSRKPFPRQEVIGGPRIRCFFENQGENSYLRRLYMHIVERGAIWLRARHIMVPFIRLKATPLFKVPLVKWKKGYAYTASTHQMNPVKITAVTGALLHFKFFSDFHERVVEAVRNDEHAQGSVEYKRYLERMDKIGNLHYAGSVAYHSTADLLETGLIKTTPQYEKFRQAASL